MKIKTRNRTPDFMRKGGPMKDRKKAAKRNACRGRVKKLES